MIKGINQAMVNRSIVGGGVPCKCINGNGINVNSSNGGKITVEFTVYEVEETSGEPPTTTTKQYIKKEDADKVFREILSIDLEKYAFYQAVIYTEISNGMSGTTFGSCGGFNMMDENGNRIITIATTVIDLSIYIQMDNDNNINYSKSNIIEHYSTEDPIPDTAVSTHIKCTWYYKEL